MSWFHFTKLERLKRNRETRREYAEEARRTAIENPAAIHEAVSASLELALEEERTFREYFSEPMPQHVDMALSLEVILWRRLQAAIEAPADERRSAFRDGVQALLLIIINLLHAEEEMVTSCLVQHYLTITRALQAESARVSL